MALEIVKPAAADDDLVAERIARANGLHGRGIWRKLGDRDSVVNDLYVGESVLSEGVCERVTDRHAFGYEAANQRPNEPIARRKSPIVPPAAAAALRICAVV